MRKRVIIMGAAGRDFHNFNVHFRDNKDYEIVAFTATQIPDIAGRRYPKELSCPTNGRQAGNLYPDGIPIYEETKLKALIKDLNVDIVAFSYSDVSHNYVMHKASEALACGVDFMLLGPKNTMLKSKKPVIAVCAVRTGCGKSQTTRYVSDILKAHNKKVVVVRHPMPYGDLRKQICQRFETYKDMDNANCTIEEREEYEPHIQNNTVVYAGVDYAGILKQAEKEADIILWDGGNNDLSFYNPDILIVVADPLRPGHELLYYPGETNLRMAHVVVINKIDSAKSADIEKVKKNIKTVNPEAEVILAESPISVGDPSLIKGKNVLVIEDGPTLTHGGMEYGAGIVAAKQFSAKSIVSPRKYAVGSIIETYNKYSNTREILPAMGYGETQIKELEQTINKTPCDTVIIATPIDLGKVLKIDKPSTRVTYELKEVSKPDLEEILSSWFIVHSS